MTGKKKAQPKPRKTTGEAVAEERAFRGGEHSRISRRTTPATGIELVRFLAAAFEGKLMHQPNLNPKERAARRLRFEQQGKALERAAIDPEASDRRRRTMLEIEPEPAWEIPEVLAARRDLVAALKELYRLQDRLEEGAREEDVPVFDQVWRLTRVAWEPGSLEDYLADMVRAYTYEVERALRLLDEWRGYEAFQVTCETLRDLVFLLERTARGFKDEDAERSRALGAWLAEKEPPKLTPQVRAEIARRDREKNPEGRKPLSALRTAEFIARAFARDLPQLAALQLHEKTIARVISEDRRKRSSAAT